MKSDRSSIVKVLTFPFFPAFSWLGSPLTRDSLGDLISVNPKSPLLTSTFSIQDSTFSIQVCSS